MARRDSPNTFSKAVLANSMRPSTRTTATIVASTSKAVRSSRCARPSGVLRVGHCGAAACRRRQLGQLAPDRGDVGLLARDAFLHLAHAVEVALVVALAAEAIGFAVVVFGLQRGEPLFLALELAFEDAPRLGVARALVRRVDPFARRARAARSHRRRQLAWFAARCPGSPSPARLRACGSPFPSPARASSGWCRIGGLPGQRYDDAGRGLRRMQPPATPIQRKQESSPTISCDDSGSLHAPLWRKPVVNGKRGGQSRPLLRGRPPDHSE